MHTSRISDEKFDQGFFNVIRRFFEDINLSKKSIRDLLHLYVLLLRCIFSND